MAITDWETILAKLPGQTLVSQKNPGSQSQAPSFQSLWTTNFPLGVAPSAMNGVIPTSTTAGALTFANPTGGQKSYLARAEGAYARSNSTAYDGGLWLYDRLWHNLITSVTQTSPDQSISQPALTRPDANGTDAELWYQVYTTMGAGTPDVTIGYTNSAGTSGLTTTTGTLVTAMAANRTNVINLGAADLGVKSVQTWDASASFTSGAIGLVIRRYVTGFHFIGASNQARGDRFTALQLGIPRVYDDACLELVQGSPGSSGNMLFTQTIQMVQG